ncbi:MAG TPA: hypothetical protein EYG88_07375 [Desulfocapsa sulfexigens]|nr:hypothetical protein [Desulfocapsa sulfexigens]
MKKIFPDLPNWSFNLDEVSANVYEAIGTDKYGHKVSYTGTDLEAILSQCKCAAKKIDKSLKGDSNDGSPQCG